MRSDDAYARKLRSGLNDLLTLERTDPRVESILVEFLNSKAWTEAHRYAMGDVFTHEVISLDELGVEPKITVQSASRALREVFYAEAQITNKRYELAEERLAKASRKWKKNREFTELRAMLATYQGDREKAFQLASKSVEQGGAHY